VSHYSGSVPELERAADWRDFAACRQESPNLFFPDGSTGPWLLIIEQAKAVCRRCPVVDRCLQWALETGQEAGVWGGLSEDERRVLRRRTARDHPAPEPERTRAEVYADLYAQHTKATADGHVLWNGPAPTVNVDGKHVAYTRLAFEVGIGKPPYGPVKADCERYRCVAAEHLSDATIRAARKAAV
jgi:WhiB family redox-sensing transcriptional regulator